MQKTRIFLGSICTFVIAIRILISIILYQKVVIRVSMHGDKCRIKAMDIFIKVMKVMIPFESLWNDKMSLAAKNRIRAMKVVAGVSGTKIRFSHLYRSMAAAVIVLVWFVYMFLIFICTCCKDIYVRVACTSLCDKINDIFK